MTIFEDYQLFLPKYLSSESSIELFRCLKDFPENVDSRLYSRNLKNEMTIFQGDGYQNVELIDIDDGPRSVPAIIISNTCDIDDSNRRLFPSRVIYAPILRLGKYITMLKEVIGLSNEQLDNHIRDVKSQRITHIFYLPSGINLAEDSIVFLDQIYSCKRNRFDSGKITLDRLFTLSDYGFYLFVVKLSIHLTRVMERVDRSKGTFS